jgi:hypothetical protein
LTGHKHSKKPADGRNYKINNVRPEIVFLCLPGLSLGFAAIAKYLAIEATSGNHAIAPHGRLTAQVTT